MKKEGGSSLVEIIIVVVIIGFIVLLMANLPPAMGLITKGNHLSLAREIASKQIEDKRSTNYINLVNGTNGINDTRINLLPQGSGTITIVDCNPSICANGEHAKQVTVTVNWKDNLQPQTTIITTLIGEGGLSK